MRPKGARESSRAEPETGVMPLHRKCRNPISNFSRVAGFFFLSFFRKLRKRKENPIDPVNPVR